MSQWNEVLSNIESPWLILIVMCFAVVCSIHAIIYKRESYAAFAWLGVILLSPLVFSVTFLLWDWKGIFLIAPLIASSSYLLLGVNRLTRQYKHAAFRRKDSQFNHEISQVISPLIDANKKWSGLSSTGKNLNYSPINYCELDILNSGDEAYPAMLSSINEASKSIALYSYIFQFDHTGKQFCDALIHAASRGVKVKVLVDAVGSHSTINELENYLHAGKVECSRFMPVLVKTQFSNLRNHRKLLIVDAQEAYTGGLNIADDYWPSLELTAPIYDLHFKVMGRLVNYLQEVFSNDWSFATKEELTSTDWFNENLPEQGECLGRLIVDGPGRNEERLSWHFLSAINSAETSIKILTPYFLPSLPITTALCSAALRGVKVEIVVPYQSDHFFMDWALRGSVYELLSKGCLLYLSQGAFDHSKLLIVDNNYASIGSSNWDSRSLRLNYELNIEVYSSRFAETLDALFISKKQSCMPYTTEDWLGRSLLIKLRDGIARLFSPYL